jgi:hypothetical protein
VRVGKRVSCGGQHMPWLATYPEGCASNIKSPTYALAAIQQPHGSVRGKVCGGPTAAASLHAAPFFILPRAVPPRPCSFRVAAAIAVLVAMEIGHKVSKPSVCAGFLDMA